MEEALFWITWVVFTSIVVFATVYYPAQAYEEATKTDKFIGTITEERLLQKAYARDPIHGIDYDTLRDPFGSKAVVLSMPPYTDFGYKISANGQEFKGNPDYYDIASVLVGVSYDRTKTTKEMTSNGKKVELVVDVVFPKT